jgi:hypothetical protein
MKTTFRWLAGHRVQRTLFVSEASRTVVALTGEPLLQGEIVLACDSWNKLPEKSYELFWESQPPVQNYSAVKRPSYKDLEDRLPLAD